MDATNVKPRQASYIKLWEATGMQHGPPALNKLIWSFPQFVTVKKRHKSIFLTNLNIFEHLLVNQAKDILSSSSGSAPWSGIMAYILTTTPRTGIHKVRSNSLLSPLCVGQWAHAFHCDGGSPATTSGKPSPWRIYTYTYIYIHACGKRWLCAEKTANSVSDGQGPVNQSRGANRILHSKWASFPIFKKYLLVRTKNEPYSRASFGGHSIFMVCFWWFNPRVW